MSVPPDNAAPSKLSDVLRQVRDAFGAVGDATLVQVGAQYRDQFGVGNGPRVLFVPEVRGNLQDPIDMGMAASMGHGCDLFLRADAETDDDYARFDPVCDLADFVIDLIHTAAPGRISWGECADDSPVKTDTGIGIGLALHFEYRRDIRHNARRWAAPIVTAQGVQPGLLTEAPDDSPPFLPSAPGANYADAADPTVNDTPVDPST